MSALQPAGRPALLIRGWRCSFDCWRYSFECRRSIPIAAAHGWTIPAPNVTRICYREVNQLTQWYYLHLGQPRVKHPEQAKRSLL